MVLRLLLWNEFQLAVSKVPSDKMMTFFLSRHRALHPSTCNREAGRPQQGFLTSDNLGLMWHRITRLPFHLAWKLGVLSLPEILREKQKMTHRRQSAGDM